MDKKKKISLINAFIILFWGLTLPLSAQSISKDVGEIRFCDKSYEYGNDSITLFLKILDSNGKRSMDVDTSDLKEHFILIEDEKPIAKELWNVKELISGQRIPSDYTISVLVDLSIPTESKDHIYKAVESLVESAHDSCVFISFFGDEVGKSQMITKENYKDFKKQFQQSATNKYFYSALYAKLTEFSFTKAQHEDSIKACADYYKNPQIFTHAGNAPDKNLLFIFTDGKETPQFEEISFPEVTEYQNEGSITPKVYAFYNTENGIDNDMELTLKGITTPLNENKSKGAYMPSDNIKSVIENFEQAVRDEMYDFALTYRATEKNYNGKVKYTALWNDEEKGAGVFSIGTEENPWHIRTENNSNSFIKYLIALLVTLLTILLFIFIMKVFIPGMKSKLFSIKYYKRYNVEENVKRMICHYCRREIMPGDKVVAKCKHIMHVQCWKENGYKCAEYGQNCKDGIQDHIHWRELFSVNTFRDCLLTIMGNIAALVSWIIYEASGRSLFKGLAQGIVNTFYANKEQANSLSFDCVSKVSSFLAIGLLLAFFLSLIFRYFDGVRKKDWKSLLKITGLSLLSGIIGMAAFALGAIILCLWLSPTDTFIPWYCSLPAYLLFSICTSLSLTIKSTIPVKSALIGGICSAIIGFVVLYFSRFNHSRWEWMNMLLNFVIYGGGLGASLITVRMLAEKYFLVIKNGVKAGQRIPIHKWMNATGGGNKVTIGMTERCEIQMTWEKSNKVAKEHAQLYVDHSRSQAMLKPLAPVLFNSRAELPANKPVPLFNGDTLKIGDTIFQYVEN